MRFRSSIKRQLSNTERGFSILEVLITAAIIGIITAVVAFRYGSFNNAVLLKNQAYEIALDIREAQIVAVSALGQQTGLGSNEFREDYGIYFNIETDLGRTQYLMFQDRGELIESGRNMAYYDSEPYDEKIGPTANIDSRFKIGRICINIISADNNCPHWVTDLSVSFKRPNFDAQFASVDARNRGLGVINNARIEIINAVQNSDRQQSVIVNSTGQIYVSGGSHTDTYTPPITPSSPPPSSPPPSSPPQITSMVVVDRDSSSACTLNSSYGFDQSRLWVDSGCRAVFQDNNGTCYKCSSSNYNYRECPYSTSVDSDCRY